MSNDNSVDAKKANSVESTTLEKVPNSERKSWQTIALIQAGVMICVPSLMLGGLLVQGMTLTNAILAGTVGYAIAIAIMTFMGIQGFDLGVPTVVCVSSSFGKLGSKYIISILFAISLLGWFAVQTSVCGSAFSSLMGIAFGINIPVPLSSFIWGVVMLITAVYGINALSVLNYVSVPSLVVLCFYGCFVAIKTKGYEILFSHVPTETMGFIDGVSLTVGFLIVGSVIAADYTRYQKSRKDTVKSTVIGIMPTGIAMLVMGAIMSLIAGTYDITIVLGELGIPLIGAVILILATWTTNTTNAYSAGIDIVMLLNLKDDKRAMVTMIAGLIGTILGVVGIINYFEVFLNWSGYLFVPIAGVALGDYFFLMKGRAESWKPTEGFDFLALLAWGLGSAVSIIITSGFPILYGFFVAMAVYIIGKKITSKQTA